MRTIGRARGGENSNENECLRQLEGTWKPKTGLVEPARSEVDHGRSRELVVRGLEFVERLREALEVRESSREFVEE